MSRADAAFAALHLLTWLALAIQLFVDFSYDNIVGALCVVASSSATFLYIRRTDALHEVPLSSFAVLGLCFTTQWGALVGQAFLRDSMTANLRVPLQTFGYLLGFQLVAIASHWVSRRVAIFMTTRAVVADMLIKPLGLFRVPPVQAIWAVGIMGLASIVGAYAGEASILGKISDGFRPLAWAPFVIPLLAQRMGSAYCDIRKHALPLVGFVGLAVLLGLAVNSRSLMLVGVVTAALLFLLYLLGDERPFQWQQLRFVAYALLLTLLLYVPVSYVVKATEIAREQRDKLSRLDMIKHTLQVLQEVIVSPPRENLPQGRLETGAYDERYFDSNVLGRLVETKFHDNGFFMVEGVSPLESRLIADDAADRVWAVLPFPVLKWLGLERTKYATLYSAGDLLSYLRLGQELGSFRTGSMFAQSIAMFGVWTPLLYFLFCIALFFVWDILGRTGRHGAPAVVSVIGMLLVYRIFANGLVSESISGQLGLLLRFQFQNVLLLALVFAATRIVWKSFEPHATVERVSGESAANRARPALAAAA
jgi:hypothetical protein